MLEDVYNFEDALLVGGMMITMLRHADRVKIACLAQLVNVIAPIMTSDTGIWKQTIYYPFELISNYGRGEVLNTLIKVPAYESKHGDAPYLDCVVTVNEEEEFIAVFMVNKDLEEAMVKKHFVLTHENLKAVNTEENPFEVVPRENGNALVEDGVLKAVLPAKSFHTIIISKQ